MTEKTKINLAKERLLKRQDSPALRKLIIEESKKLIQELKTQDITTITAITKKDYEKRP